MNTWKLYQSGIYLALGAFFCVSAFASDFKFQSMEKYTRILVPISPGATFKTINGNREITIQVDRTQVAGLPTFGSWADSRIASVDVKAAGMDRLELNVKFQKEGVESFAFLQGGGLVLDFWADSVQKTAQAPIEEEKNNAKKDLKIVKVKPAKVAEHKVKVAQRAPAQAANSEERRKKILPLKLDQDIVQKFILPMPDLNISNGKGIALPPSDKMEDGWEIAPTIKDHSDEGKEFSFALKLYRDGKYGLAIKAVEIILPKVKDPWTDDFRFLSAMAYQKLGETTNTPSLGDKAELVYKELLLKRDKAGNPSAMHRKIRSYLARKEYKNQNWLVAIDHLESLILDQNDPEGANPYFQILLAEAYVKVNQPRRAERLYRDLVARKKDHILAKEAVYRIADLLALEKNYSRVNDQVVEAIRLYPDHEVKRSETLFQAGEANFWLGDYKRSERYLKRYIELSSAQTNAALAWVRLGEIAEIARGNLEEARKSYQSAKNGYPFSRGDLVATVRLARIDLYSETEPEFIIKSLQSMLADASIDGEMKQMAEITLGDYLLRVKSVDKAIELARAGIAKSSGLVYEAYKRNYIEALYDKLRQLRDEKQFAPALAMYDKERKWLDSYGPETFKVLSDIYGGLGLRKTSTQMLEKYLVGIRQNNRSLASVTNESKKLSESKGAASFYSGDYRRALQELPKNSNDPKTTVLIAIAAHESGERNIAFQYFDRFFSSGETEKIEDAQLEQLARIAFERARAERDFSLAERDLKKIQARMEKKSELVSFLASEALWLQKKNSAALESYTKSLEEFPKSQWIPKARYHMGVALIGMGKREEAVKQLTLARDSNDGVWSESAKQELDLVDWEKKYSSVLRTLPPTGLGITN